MAETLRRLELRLPVNHPIFDVDPRLRVKMAVSWMDAGARMTALEAGMTGLETGLSGVENQLAEMKQMLAAGIFVAKENEHLAKQEEKQARTTIDIAAFTNAVCDL